MISIKVPQASLSGIVWLAAYALVIGLVVGGLLDARRRTIDALERPEATAAWNAWRAEERESRTNARNPVARRPPAAAEPPALVLMRDSFPEVLAAAMVFATFFFLFAMLVIRGLLRQAGSKPDAKCL